MPGRKPNPHRPKLKYKPVRKPKPPGKSIEQRRLEAIAKLEARHGINPQRVCAMIAKERGLLTNVCRSLKIPRTTLIKYIEKHEVCIDALNVARDAMGDMAERKLFEAIEAGDVRCLLYYLSTVHKHRGYTQNVGDGNDPANNGGKQVFIEQVNIVGIAPGTFLPKEIARKDNMVIDG